MLSTEMVCGGQSFESQLSLCIVGRAVQQLIDTLMYYDSI